MTPLAADVLTFAALIGVTSVAFYTADAVKARRAARKQGRAT